MQFYTAWAFAVISSARKKTIFCYSFLLLFFSGLLEHHSGHHQKHQAHHTHCGQKRYVGIITCSGQCSQRYSVFRKHNGCQRYITVADVFCGNSRITRLTGAARTARIITARVITARIAAACLLHNHEFPVNFRQLVCVNAGTRHRIAGNRRIKLQLH